MKHLLDPDFQRVLEASTLADLQAELVSFAMRLGFPLVAGLTVIDRLGSTPEFISIDNTPENYRHRYADPAVGQRDPVMQHCKARGLPIAWNQATYVAAGEGEAWEAQAIFGYQCGISLPFHFPKGRHFVLGVVRDQALPQNSAEMTRIVAALCLLAAHAQESVERLLGKTISPGEAESTLTPRELECLRWTMEGKTAWEVGRILGIAENTAVRHLHSATRKLDSVNKHHAVLQALRKRLI